MEMGLIDRLVEFIQSGGAFMFPILLVGAIGIGIAIERYIKLSLVRVSNKRLWGRLQPVLAEGNFEKAREMTGKDDSTVSQLLSLGLARQGAVRRREDIEIAMEEGHDGDHSAAGEAHALRRALSRTLPPCSACSEPSWA